MAYLEQFMQQWKVFLHQRLAEIDAPSFAPEPRNDQDIEEQSLAYFRYLRETRCPAESGAFVKDDMTWLMLQKQLKALAEKAEKGTSELVAKLHINAAQIEICLNFRYDEEQHVFYVS